MNDLTGALHILVFRSSHRRHLCHLLLQRAQGLFVILVPTYRGLPAYQGCPGTGCYNENNVLSMLIISSLCPCVTLCVCIVRSTACRCTPNCKTASCAPSLQTSGLRIRPISSSTVTSRWPSCTLSEFCAFPAAGTT